MSDITIVPILLTVIMALAAAAVVYAKWHWAVRWSAVTLMLGVGLMMWPVVNSLRGWAVDAELPEIYKLHWVVVEEPQGGHPGGIFILVQSLKPEIPGLIDHHIDRGSPRLYSIPYTRQAHKQAQELQLKIMGGGSPTMRRGKSGKPGGVPGQGEGPEGPGGGNPYAAGQNEQPMGYELPPPKFPSKD